MATNWRCFASAGPTVEIIQQVGEERVKRTALESLKPFTRDDGTVLQKNRFHWILAARP